MGGDLGAPPFQGGGLKKLVDMKLKVSVVLQMSQRTTLTIRR